jgi:uncharacterized membrane protein (UPF0127 family)
MLALSHDQAMRYEPGILTCDDQQLPCVKASDRQARRAGARGIGLLAGQALLLPGEPFVHMRGIGRSLDLVFCGPRGRIVAVYANVSPGLRLRGHLFASCCVELEAGYAQRLGLVRGRTLRFYAAPPR